MLWRRSQPGHNITPPCLLDYFKSTTDIQVAILRQQQPDLLGIQPLDVTACVCSHSCRSAALCLKAEEHNLTMLCPKNRVGCNICSFRILPVNLLNNLFNIMSLSRNPKGGGNLHTPGHHGDTQGWGAPELSDDQRWACTHLA